VGLSEKRKAYKRQWWAENRSRHLDRMKERARERNYGLTSDQFTRMFKDQDGRCAICKADFASVRMHVDHDHHTGKVRALLCADCNLALGRVERGGGVAWLKAAEVYLRRFG